MVSYCSNNVAKTCSYEIKISRNTEIKYTYQFKAYSPVLVTFYTSCLSAVSIIFSGHDVFKMSSGRRLIYV